MVVGVVVEQEEGALSRAPVRVGQVLEEPLVVGEVVLVDSSVCKYHGHGTAEAGGRGLTEHDEHHLRRVLQREVPGDGGAVTRAVAPVHR